MTTYRIDLAYHGAEFAGWAAQPGRRTVQAELAAALEKLFDGPISPLAVAGRTDAGVHALGQVASFVGEARATRDLRYALNGITADDIAVHAASPAPDSFDARRDASSRTYCYRLLASRVADPFERGLSLWWPGRLDRDALVACAEALLGAHDFTAFTPTQSAHRRFRREVTRAEWRFSEGDGICEFWIEARAFMRGMVRALVGTMLEVGSGRREIGDFRRLLEGAPRREGGDSARAHGLYLARVSYKKAPLA